MSDVWKILQRHKFSFLISQNSVWRIRIKVLCTLTTFFFFFCFRHVNTAPTNTAEIFWGKILFVIFFFVELKINCSFSPLYSQGTKKKKIGKENKKNFSHFSSTTMRLPHAINPSHNPVCIFWFLPQDKNCIKCSIYPFWIHI